MAAPTNQWRIEIRTYRVGDGTNFAHTFLAFVDPQGNVVREIHGHPGKGGSGRTPYYHVQDLSPGFHDYPLNVFIWPNVTDVTSETFLGPEGRTFPPIWTGTVAEAQQMLSGLTMVGQAIEANGNVYQALNLNPFTGDAINSNAVTRTMVDFIRDYAAAQGIGQFGVPESVIGQYKRDGYDPEIVAQSVETGIPVQLLDDSIVSEDGVALQAPGIHRNLVKIDPSTGQTSDSIDESLIYPPSLQPLLAPPARSRPQQSPRSALDDSPKPGEDKAAAAGGAEPPDHESGDRDPGPSAAETDRGSTSASGAEGAGRLGEALLRAGATGIDTLLTVPGPAMSRAQREALMQLTAFSDPSDPLFGPAVWKYRDANAGAAMRAVATGAIDAFGRPARPVFAETDGAPADADGRPLAEALADTDSALGEAARALGPAATVSALQGAVNDLGDAQVQTHSPRDGKQANRLLPRLAVDGVAGPRTAGAVRLALHHVGAAGLDRALEARLRQLRHG